MASRSNPVTRTVRSLRQRGTRDTLRRAAEAVRELAARTLYLDESHIWYARQLPVPASSLPEGLELDTVTADGIEVMLDYPFPDLRTAEGVVARGDATGWTLREGGKTIFSCWTFENQMPAVQARGGWLRLPPDVRFLENATAAPNQRGRNLSGTTYTAMSERLVASGAGTLMTKIPPENAPARKSAERFGFQPVAVTRFRRVLGHRRVEVSVQNPGASWLQTNLA